MYRKVCFLTGIVLPWYYISIETFKDARLLGLWLNDDDVRLLYMLAWVILQQWKKCWDTFDLGRKSDPLPHANHCFYGVGEQSLSIVLLNLLLGEQYLALLKLLQFNGIHRNHFWQLSLNLLGEQFKAPLPFLKTKPCIVLIQLMLYFALPDPSILEFVKIKPFAFYWLRGHNWVLFSP